MDGMKDIELTTIARGALPELFKRELDAVLANIADVNTPAEKVREITMKVKIKPSGDRSSAAVLVECSSKPAAVSPVASPIFISIPTNGSKPRAFGQDHRQEEMALEEAFEGVRNIAGATGLSVRVTRGGEA